MELKIHVAWLVVAGLVGLAIYYFNPGNIMAR